MLTIDSQLAIDSLVLQSEQPVDVLEVKDCVCKRNQIKDGKSTSLLMTLKMNSEDQKRVSIKLRTAEGSAGSLSVFVLPHEKTSNKTCSTLSVPIKPLCLHERVPGLTDAHRESLPLSEITVTGSFSLDDGIQWVSNLLPEVPQTY